MDVSTSSKTEKLIAWPICAPKTVNSNVPSVDSMDV